MAPLRSSGRRAGSQVGLPLRLALLLLLCRVGQALQVGRDADHALSTPPQTAAAAAHRLPALRPRPTAANCSELWFEQPVDQFDYNGGGGTWQQRYFLCDRFFQAGRRPAAPVLFYAGNEGTVVTAVDTLGLLWEMAADWGALLVFAEHRYYGRSFPVNGTAAADQRYLSVEQALTDYVKLIQHVRDQHASQDSPVVAIGASYGAMLAAWLRARYPHVVAAALAASAPLCCTLVGSGGWEPSSFWEVVTHAAGPAGGSPPTCTPTVQAAFAALYQLSATTEGRRAAERALRLCDGVLERREDVDRVALFLMMAFDTAAMGMLPFPSWYFTGDPSFPLPAWPMRQLCKEMQAAGPSAEELLQALAGAVAVVHNVTRDPGLQCYSAERVYAIAMQAGSSFNYQVCSQLLPSESFFPSNGASDMFPNLGSFNASALNAFCQEQFGPGGPLPDLRVLPLLFGASAADFSAASNIVFSNGLLDPWSSGGFLKDLSDSLVAVVIPNGGHHVDLAWPNPADPPEYGEAREREKKLLERFLAQHRRQQQSEGGGDGNDHAAWDAS